MPLYGSDGQVYETEADLLIDNPTSPKNDADAGEKSYHTSSIDEVIPSKAAAEQTNLQPLLSSAVDTLMPEYLKTPELTEVTPGVVGKVPSNQPAIQDNPLAAVATGLVDILNPATKAGVKLGVIAGASAVTANKTKLAMAQYMESIGGFTKDDIFDKTGWFRGRDKEWRFELPDVTADIKPNALNNGFSGTLDEVLVHPELFEAYPELGKSIKVVVDNNFERGVAMHHKGVITINMKKIQDRAMSPKAILMHEIQHAIQHKEKFDPGTSVVTASEAYATMMRNRFLNAQTQEDRLKLYEMWKALIGSKNEREFAKFGVYRHAPGEVEARTVERRAEGRRLSDAYPPYKDIDVDPDAIYPHSVIRDYIKEKQAGVK